MVARADFQKSWNSRLTRLLMPDILFLAPTHGELAQLGERVTGSHEVRGSNPLFSTMINAGGGFGRRLFFIGAHGATVSAGDS